MDEPYKRPDRAAIAARVHAELAAQSSALPAAGPDTEPITGEPAPLPEPQPDSVTPAARRCRGCGYLTNTIGHWWACHG